MAKTLLHSSASRRDTITEVVKTAQEGCTQDLMARMFGAAAPMLGYGAKLEGVYTSKAHADQDLATPLSAFVSNMPDAEAFGIKLSSHIAMGACEGLYTVALCPLAVRQIQCHSSFRSNGTQHIKQLWLLSSC